jgi:hypothetical protein
MIRVCVWWLGAMLIGAWLGLEAIPAQGLSCEANVTALEIARSVTGWVACLGGCVAVTHARRLTR